MIQATAPGKVYLFGEHAVVYGRPAIACAIDLRTRVRLFSSKREGVHVGRGRAVESVHRLPYLNEAVRLVEEVGGQPISNVKLKITTSIPTGAGLGSSAAVVVATIGALAYGFGLDIPREKIAKMGHEVERRVQGSASPTDTHLSTFGGTYIMPERRRLNPPMCSMVVGDTRKSGSTRALVGMVRELKERYPAVVDGIMDSIAALSLEGRALLEKGEFSELGRLMSINHSLLGALGVSTPELERLVHTVMGAGAYGAKITGAGGGGCIVCLVDEKDSVEVVDAIRRTKARAYPVHPAEDGLRVEG
ncbi:MAG: mevalonate kinase [Methermicoccaceae archaeon]